MLSVSPCGETCSEQLVLSTLGHELGHAIFDAPGWIVDASQGLDLFDDPEEVRRKAYRTTTRDSEHLVNAASSSDGPDQPARASANLVGRDQYFAELRANEFMGSLLVPRQRLSLAIEALAPQYGLKVHRHATLNSALPGGGISVTADHLKAGDFVGLRRALGKRFGVHGRFIEVRMERYGLIQAQS